MSVNPVRKKPLIREITSYSHSPSTSSTPAEKQPEWLRDLDFEQELKSAVDDILQACPKFRILILGRAGVGKSNLINAIFKSDLTTVEHGRRAGVSNIEKEIISPLNPRLILHDSQGFCHGNGDNFDTVKKFIETRSQMTNLKDRLHAIWLCSAVPTYGGSLLEVCEEEILQMKNCSVPTVAVFTKYDVLVESLKPPDEENFYGDIEKEIENLDKDVDPDMGLNTGTSASQIDPHVLSLAEEKLCEMITPFEVTLGTLWVKVSVKPEFSGTLEKLVDVTLRRVNKSLELLWASTQQQRVVPKIKASIDVGKQRYPSRWDLSTGLNRGGKSLANWFEAIHSDIVDVWDIYDPKKVLLTSMTKEMSKLQQDVLEGGPNVLRGMMGYIVDLTIVMQRLYILMQARTQASGSRSPVNEKLFNITLDAYKQDFEHSLQKVHEEIRSFATRKNALSKSGRVLDEVERLINPSEKSVRENTLKSLEGSSGIRRGKLRDFVTIGYFNPWQIPVEPLPYLSVKYGMDRDLEGILWDSVG